MASIAIVQSYPYESSINGDASYIDSIGNYLSDLGHDVTVLVTNIDRKRSSPFYKINYDVKKYRKYTVNNALILGNTVVSLSPRQWVKSFLRVFKIRVSDPPREQWNASDAAWAEKQIRKSQVSRAILMREASGFAKTLRPALSHSLSVPIFLNFRNFQNVDGRATEFLGSPSMMEEEIKWLIDSDCIGLHSRSDGVFLESRTAVPCIQVGIGIKKSEPLTIKETPAQPSVLFVAANASQNLVSLRWFLDCVWDLVRAKRPTARLRVVGSVGEHPQFREAPEGVEIVGMVDDIKAEYAKATVVVAPLVQGTAGMKVKVAEAIAYGCALVTTTLGIGVGEASAFFDVVSVADEPEPFAAAIVQLLDDQALRDQRRAISATLYDTHLSHTAAFAEMCAHLEI